MKNTVFHKLIQRLKKVKLTKQQKKVLVAAAETVAPINPNHPKAPVSHPLPVSTAKNPKTQTQQIVALANEGLKFAGKMYYTETGQRTELFGRSKGNFSGAHADCSQYVASILNWVGIKGLTNYDYTGTLLQKGKLISAPKKGCVAVWGPGTGAHTAIITGYASGNWYCVGFGHQAAPDRNTLAGMNEYFNSVGQPGVRFLSFT